MVMSERGLLILDNGGTVTPTSEDGDETDSEWSSPSQQSRPLPSRTGMFRSLVKKQFGAASPETSKDEYTLFKRRWFMLATLSLLNISNGTVIQCSVLFLDIHCSISL